MGVKIQRLDDVKTQRLPDSSHILVRQSLSVHMQILTHKVSVMLLVGYHVLKRVIWGCIHLLCPCRPGVNLSPHHFFNIHRKTLKMSPKRPSLETGGWSDSKEKDKRITQI